MRYRGLVSFLDEYDSLLIDMDGVIARGEQFFGCAIETLNIFKSKNIFICTNSVRRTPDIISSRLCAKGFFISAEQIFTGARSAINYITKNSDKKDIFLIGCGDAATYFKEQGITLAASIAEAKIVVLGAIAEEDMNLRTYTELVNWHIDGGVIIATSEDLVVPAIGGSVKIGTGILSSFLKNVSAENYVLVGKPGTFYFNEVVHRLTMMGGRRPIMIGDTYSTDILGAANVGIDGLFITGETSKRAGARSTADSFSHFAQVTIHEAPN